jgi:FAD/FMN-containing dehydrogenase
MSYHFYRDQVGMSGVAPEFRRLMGNYFKDIEESGVDPTKMETLCIAILEEHDEEVLKRKMALLEKTIKENNGEIIGKNYAKDWETSQLHAFYEPWKNLEMGRGSNWVGFGGMIRLSKFAEARKLFHNYLEEHKEELGKYGISGAYMGYLHETTSFAVYPCLLGDQWDPKNREIVVAHTKKIRDLFLTSDTGWLPYYLGEIGSEGMLKAWAGPHYYLLRELKKIFDPNRIINPGMFGL